MRASHQPGTAPHDTVHIATHSNAAFVTAFGAPRQLQARGEPCIYLQPPPPRPAEPASGRQYTPPDPTPPPKHAHTPWVGRLDTSDDIFMEKMTHNNPADQHSKPQVA